MARNVELLQRVMDHIDTHPDQHEQEIWARANECGTVACFAGWAAILAYGPGVIGDRALCAYDNGFRIPGTPDDQPMSVQAAELLGLTTNESLVLFAAFNTRDELRDLVEDLIAGRELPAYEAWAARNNHAAEGPF